MDALLRIENLSVDFVTDLQTTSAVKNISLHVNRGEILALVGESGSGKSVTALSILQLLPVPPASYNDGKILFSEQGAGSIDLLQIKPRGMQQVRGNKIAMIFQEPMTSLNPVMTCGSQVVEALQAHKNLTSNEAHRQAILWLERVKLPSPASVFRRYPHELSGGQKQRVMIAMAMCCHPSLLLCDEPTTALDVTVQKTILQLIRDLQQELQMGVIFITHDLGVVAEIADRVAIMYRGEIVEQGNTKKIFHGAVHPYTRALIACRPALHPKSEKLPTVSDFLDPNVPKSHLFPKPGDATAGRGESFVTDQDEHNPLITVKDLVVRFSDKKNLIGNPTSYVTAVDHVSFEITKGETLGLVGESGCGKTTLGRTLLRLIEPASGTIAYKGINLTALSKQELKEMRQNVQLIFQDPYSSLNPRITVGDAIAEPLKITGIENNLRKRKERVSELLQRVTLSPDMMNRYPHEFSGGQRQRIVIARALAMNPGFVVCDESVSALDVSVQAQVLNLLNDLKDKMDLTLLFISHDLSVVRYMCDRIMVMQKGRIVESGPAEEVYFRPVNEYTKQLIDAIPSIPEGLEGG